MGDFAARSGISSDLYAAFNVWLRRSRAGLAHASISACAAFGAVCGSSLPTAATMGRVALPEMRRFGYSDRLATGAIAAGGTIGILIPPSVIMLIYGILTETSIGDLFIAGVIPGLLLTLFFMITVLVVVRLDPSSAPPVSDESAQAADTAVFGKMGVWEAETSMDRDDVLKMLRLTVGNPAFWRFSLRLLPYAIFGRRRNAGSATNE